ncbi:hypothetical protein O6H91_18G019900 [Diphasiastrum complanatum]|uniref:Uncharacterized protein n=2 Tax=Diphasiastrum complanatum TaxID=34168 RepID=A0ACC2AYJ5_DIPCM|nr:hypothetical protein O6H91_18G019700 [Diphasiastrum complanatum]KAJ7522619.1 hypothetical protein O6H91_18G019900 [Diphasiastrum complanatum]
MAAMALSFFVSRAPPTPSSASSSTAALHKHLGFNCCQIAAGRSVKQLQAVKQTAHFSPATAPLVVQPVASRRCTLTGKRANNGYKVSFSNHRTKKLQGVNLQYKRLWWEDGKRFVKLRISTKAMKTIEKKGLDAMAKEAGINLHEY